MRESLCLCIPEAAIFTAFVYRECIKVFKVSLKFEYSVLATSEITREVCACVRLCCLCVRVCVCVLVSY